MRGLERVSDLDEEWVVDPDEDVPLGARVADVGAGVADARLADRLERVHAPVVASRPLASLQKSIFSYYQAKFQYFSVILNVFVTR